MKDALTILAVFLGAGGGFAAVVGAVRDYMVKRKSLPSATDANVITVGLARDQLAADNDRLRKELAEVYTRHERDRAEWSRERTEMRAEIDALESKVRDLLGELIALRTRHDDANRTR